MRPARSLPLISSVTLLLALVACSSDDSLSPLGTTTPVPIVPSADAAPDHLDAASQPTVCAPIDPASVTVPPLTGTGWYITLESQKLSLYQGLVRANAFYNDHHPIIADVLVCNGDYENPNITVGLSDHHFSWSYTDPKDKPVDGYIVNVHAIPSTADLAERISDAVHVGARVRVWGFEVDRVNYDNGSWWTDSGCNTLLITHFCVDN